jgi:hypothetical protein
VPGGHTKTGVPCNHTTEKIADLYHQVAGKKLWSSRNDLTNKQNGRLA